MRDQRQIQTSVGQDCMSFTKTSSRSRAGPNCPATEALDTIEGRDSLPILRRRHLDQLDRLPANRPLRR
jgi:hypothetical protein